ncbi:MAG: DUF3365 domain-containing protein, partial [Myxococcota bacterium]
MTEYRRLTTITTRLVMTAFLAGAAGGCQKATPEKSGIDPKTMADALHAVMESDRTVYTRNVVN